MIFRFLDWLIDYWVMLNYVFYKFYERFWKESDPQIRGLIYAPGWVWFNILSTIFLLDGTFDCHLMSKINNLNSYKILVVSPYLLMLLINYLFLYHKRKWKDIFIGLDNISDTNEFKQRKRNVVIYIWGSIIYLVVSVIIVGLHNKSISF